MRRPWRFFRLFMFMTVLLVGMSALYWWRYQTSPQGTSRGANPLPVPRYAVVVAATDLPPYTFLTEAMVKVNEWEVPPPAGAFTVPQEVIGRLTRTFLRAGEPIYESQVTSPVRKDSIAPLLPPGTVGIALPIARLEQLPPVRVGDTVRIDAVFAHRLVKPVAQRALVLPGGIAALPSDGKRLGEDQFARTDAQEANKALIVAVAPEEAQAIAWALDSGATLFYAVLPLSPFLPFQKQKGPESNEGEQKRTSDRPWSRITKSPQPMARSLSTRRALLSAERQIPKTPPSSSPVAPWKVPPLVNDENKPSKDAQRQPTIIGVIGDKVVIFSVP